MECIQHVHIKYNRGIVLIARSLHLIDPKKKYINKHMDNFTSLEGLFLREHVALALRGKALTTFDAQLLGLS